MNISQKAANSSNRSSCVRCICFVEIKQILGQIVSLNSNPKTPDRQEVGEEVVLGAEKAYLGTSVSFFVSRMQQLNTVLILS